MPKGDESSPRAMDPSFATTLAKVEEIEKKIELFTEKPCARPECLRAQALLRERPPVRYVNESIERVRVTRMGLFWVLCLVASFIWTIACMQKKQYLLAVINFVAGFLPLWRQLYVDTPFYMTWIAWTTIVGTYALL